MSDKAILLVEDNVDDEVLTLRALKASNISNTIHVVRDGAEALDYFFRRGQYAELADQPLPQLTLLDLKLPKVDGLEVLKQLRANETTKFVPVVILTSSKEEHDIIDGYSLGANSYIQKPVDFDQFTEAVRQLGLYWLVLNQAVPV